MMTRVWTEENKKTGALDDDKAQQRNVPWFTVDPARFIPPCHTTLSVSGCQRGRWVFPSGFSMAITRSTEV